MIRKPIAAANAEKLASVATAGPVIVRWYRWWEATTSASISRIAPRIGQRRGCIARGKRALISTQRVGKFGKAGKNRNVVQGDFGEDGRVDLTRADRGDLDLGGQRGADVSGRVAD